MLGAIVFLSGVGLSLCVHVAVPAYDVPAYDVPAYDVSAYDAGDVYTSASCQPARKLAPLCCIYITCTACFLIIPIALPLPTTFPPNQADGWKLVGSLDMLDCSNPSCPTSWKQFATKMACGRIHGSACDSLIVSTGSGTFQQVCGRFRAFQWGSPDAFAQLGGQTTIDKAYVDGISITYFMGGQRQHVFTYAIGDQEYYNPSNYPQSTCPCAGGKQPPAFVSTSNYYCESGNPNKNNWYSNQIFCDPLWDGKECRFNEATCCDPPNQPWFCRDLGQPVASDLEIRLCADEGTDNEDVALESYELYVR